MDLALFKKLVVPLAAAVAKSFKANKLKMLTLSTRGDNYYANIGFTPMSATLVPTESVLRKYVASARLPGTYEIDNLEVVPSLVKSFQYSSRKVVAISLYLVSEEGETLVVEFTIVPFTGVMSVEIFPQ